MEENSTGNRDTTKEEDFSLVINLNEEYKIKIESGNQFEKSIFKDVYKAALNNVIEIITQSDKKNDYDDFNNIIAFTGERGKGKSSSMISFRDALVEHNNSSHSTFFTNKDEVKQTQFAKIDIIDPSLFRGGESLFEIILAQMFNKFQIEIKKTTSEVSDDDRRIIIKQFQEVFENLQIINSDRKDLYRKESIEALSKLATSSNLRKGFKKLVSVYLEKFEKGKHILVIAIDDFDLNVTDAYKMLEDIRQFLIQSNIILLIACKMEQLENSVINAFNNQYNNILINDSVIIAANKYLEKIFPQHRKINLPELLVSDISSIIFIGENKDLESIHLNNILDERNMELRNNLINTKKLFIGNNPEEAISNAIFKKSQLFINSPNLRQNTFFPNTFRSILSLLSVLKKNNLNQELIRYLTEIAKNNLKKEYYEIFKSLENQKIETLNIAIANSISDIKPLVDTLNLNNILFATNPLNLNVGDINTILYSINNQLNYTNQEQILFLDLLNIYYSLRLLEHKRSDENIYSFYNSSSIKVFRKSASGKFRDYIYFNKLPIKNLFDKIQSDDDKLWLMHFFVNLGKTTTKFRFESDSPYFKSIQGVTQGLFSPFALFSNILFTEKLAELINIKSAENLELFQDIKSWNSDENNLNNLLKNPMFYLELLQYFELESNKAHKSEGLEKSEQGEEIYFNTLYIYFIQSLEKALNTMSLKYPYLKIDSKFWVENHPLIKHWKKIENDENNTQIFQEIFQEIFTNQGERKYKQEEVDLSIQLIESYDNYFSDDQSNNSRGAKQAMNSIVKAFSNNKDISQQLNLHRRTMDKNLILGLKNIESLLKEISNG